MSLRIRERNSISLQYVIYIERKLGSGGHSELLKTTKPYEKGIFMERKYNIDLLRICCAVAVLIIHIISAPLANANGAVELSLATVLNKIHILMNWSVPVFFMITGYCVLGKKELTYKYCFSHVAKYIIVLFTVGLCYAFMEAIFATGSLNVSVLLPIKNVIKILYLEN